MQFSNYFHKFSVLLGFTVRLLYRSEDTVQQFKDRAGVTLVKGDVTNPNDVENTVKGANACIVTLGTRNKLEPTTVMSTGRQHFFPILLEYNKH